MTGKKLIGLAVLVLAFSACGKSLCSTLVSSAETMQKKRGACNLPADAFAYDEKTCETQFGQLSGSAKDLYEKLADDLAACAKALPACVPGQEEVWQTAYISCMTSQFH